MDFGLRLGLGMGGCGGGRSAGFFRVRASCPCWGGGSVSHIVCYYALASDRLLFIVVYTDALCVVLFPAVAGRVE